MMTRDEAIEKAARALTDLWESEELKGRLTDEQRRILNARGAATMGLISALALPRGEPSGDVGADVARMRDLLEVATSPTAHVPFGWWVSFGRECAEVLPAIRASLTPPAVPAVVVSEPSRRDECWTLTRADLTQAIVKACETAHAFGPAGDAERQWLAIAEDVIARSLPPASPPPDTRALVRAVVASYTDRPGLGEVPWSEVDEWLAAHPLLTHPSPPAGVSEREVARGVAVLRAALLACVRGMDAWGHDEDGTHPEAWPAHQEARRLTGMDPCDHARPDIRGPCATCADDALCSALALPGGAR